MFYHHTSPQWHMDMSEVPVAKLFSHQFQTQQKRKKGTGSLWSIHASTQTHTKMKGQMWNGQTLETSPFHVNLVKALPAKHAQYMIEQFRLVKHASPRHETSAILLFRKPERLGFGFALWRWWMQWKSSALLGHCAHLECTNEERI